MAFPTNIGPRTRPAWDAIANTLADGQWHTHAELAMEAGAESDLSDKSIDELIRKGYRTRHYTRRTSNAHGHSPVQDAVYRLVDVDPKDGAS